MQHIFMGEESDIAAQRSPHHTDDDGVVVAVDGIVGV